MNKKGIIYGINGPVIYLKGNTGLRMSEMVHVGEEHLVGEVISLSKKATTCLLYTSPFLCLFRRSFSTYRF